MLSPARPAPAGSLPSLGSLGTSSQAEGLEPAENTEIEVLWPDFLRWKNQAKRLAADGGNKRQLTRRSGIFKAPLRRPVSVPPWRDLI